MSSQQALDTHGITAATPSGTGFFTRQEVFDCINLLRWLAEPQDELALSGVLRSPFFALGDDTLLALRERGRLLVALADPPDEIAGSGDELGSRGWLHAVRDAHADGALREIELPEPVPPDLAAIARRRAPSALQRPAASEEQDYVPPLLERPPVIPLRASTPVTALRPPQTDRQQYGRGDGLAALRGLVVHRALEVSGGAPDSLDDAALAEIVQEQSERALEDATAQALAGEVREMLERYRGSPVADALAAPGRRALVRASLRLGLGRRAGPRQHRPRLPRRERLARDRLQERSA